MKELFLFLKRYASPYKKDIVLSVVFNFLTAFFTLFSFAFIIPILQMLFGMDTTEYSYMEGVSAEAVKNNFYYYMSELDARQIVYTCVLRCASCGNLSVEGHDGVSERVLYNTASERCGTRHTPRDV